MSFPQWPHSSSSTSSGGWTRRSPCNGNCIFVAIDVTTVTGRGKKPCMLQPSEQHTVTYRNIGGVSLSLTLSGRACRGLIFVETGKQHWSETVIAKARAEWQNAKPATVARTVDTSAHPGGSGVIDFDFAINDPGLYKQPAPVRLSFFI
jgi:hypothetical protein